MIRVVLRRQRLRRGAKLRLRLVTFRLGRQLRRARRFPAVARLRLVWLLRGRHVARLRRGRHVIFVRVFYSETVVARSHGKRIRLSVPLRRVMRLRFQVC